MKLTFILILLSAVCFGQIRYSPPRTLYNVRTVVISRTIPLLSDFSASTIVCYGDSCIYLKRNGQIVPAFIAYPYSPGPKKLIQDRSGFPKAKYSTVKKQYTVVVNSIPGNLPVISEAKYASDMFYNNHDSLVYAKRNGVISPVAVCFPYAPIVENDPVYTSPRNFYLASNGNDSYTADQAHSSATPWKTLAKFNSYRANFLPGDSILFKRGDTWVNQVNFSPKGGDSTNNIVYSAYGTGTKPIFYHRFEVAGWQIAGNWTQSGSAWYMTFADVPLRLWIDNVEVLQAHTTTVTNSNKWRISGGKLYIYSATNPATTFSSIEWPGGNYVINAYQTNYVTLANLDLRGGKPAISVKGCSRWIIDSCNIGLYSSGCGIATQISNGLQCNNWIVRNCSFVTGAAGYWGWEAKPTEDAILLYQGSNNWEIKDNYFKGWGHAAVVLNNQTTNLTISNSKIHGNYTTNPDCDYGASIGGSSQNLNETGVEIYNNIIYNHPTFSGLLIPNAKYHHNIVSNIRNNPWRETTSIGLNLDGFSDCYSRNLEIYNNVFAYCFDEGIRLGITGNDRIGNKIYNNIFYENDPNTNYQLAISLSSGNYSNEYKYNLFYKSNVTKLILYHNGVYTANEFNILNGTNGDVIENNIQSDPMLDTDFRPAIGSPVIGAGINGVNIGKY